MVSFEVSTYLVIRNIETLTKKTELQTFLFIFFLSLSKFKNEFEISKQKNLKFQNKFHSILTIFRQIDAEYVKKLLKSVIDSMYEDDSVSEVK